MGRVGGIVKLKRKRKTQEERERERIDGIRAMAMMKMGRKEFIRLERESVITTMKPQLVLGLSDLILSDSDRADFLLLCKRIEATVRAWYHLKFEELMQLYTLFDPVHGHEKLKKHNLSLERVDDLEVRFLKILFEIMSKSNYKILNDAEVELAAMGQYLINLPIAVNYSKLDSKLFPRFFQKNPIPDLPKYANQYIIFRRGIGRDRTSDYYFNEKVDALIGRLWDWLLCCVRLRRNNALPDSNGLIGDGGGINALDDEDPLFIERINVRNMELSFRNLFLKTTIQEPTFEKIIVLYREAAPSKGVVDKYANRGIHVKHFRNIPMADLELVLPEKKNPGLTPMDWTKLLVTAVLGLITFVTSLEMPKADIWVAMALLSGFLGYCAKIFFSFQQNLVEYQNLLTRSMYDKQLDSGRGTLLHLCDDVIQQEVKEAIVAYFALMEQGKATLEELDDRCEEIMEKEFNEICDFEVDDAIKKLERLGLVARDSIGRYSHQPLKSAIDTIGRTTEELVERVAM